MRCRVELSYMEFVLGAEVTQNLDAKSISTKDMPMGYDLWDTKPKPIPHAALLSTNKNQHPTTDEEQTAKWEAAGSLLSWLANGTRLDIAFAVGQCTKFLPNPDNAHCDAVKHFMIYLEGSLVRGITYDENKGVKAYGFSKGD